MKPTIARLNELFLIPDDGLLYRRPLRSSEMINVMAVGSDDGSGYLTTSVDGCSLRVHQIVFAMTRGQWAIGEIDHKNGRKFDNSPENLRDSTRSQNQHNRGHQKNSRSGVKGVVWSKQRRKWLAQIMVDRKVHYLGLFDDLQEAGKAYQAAAKRLRGDFAHA